MPRPKKKVFNVNFEYIPAIKKEKDRPYVTYSKKQKRKWERK